MSKLRISFIGDSHSVLTFGQTILPQLEKVASVHFLAFSGLKLQHLTQWWEQKEDLQILNFEKRPGEQALQSKSPERLGETFQFHTADFLIIALGTNDIIECAENGGDYRHTIEPMIRQELHKVSQRKVIFIEPPILGLDSDRRIRKELIKDIRSVGFSIVENRSFRADQTDGVHMKKEMAANFGEFVTKEILKLILPHH